MVKDLAENFTSAGEKKRKGWQSDIIRRHIQLAFKGQLLTLLARGIEDQGSPPSSAFVC
jgi:hypothetical protein